MTLKERIDKLRPIFEAATKNKLPAGRVVFFDPWPGHGEPGIYTDDANTTAVALWVTAKAAYERRKVQIWAGVLERALAQLEMIAAFAAEHEQTK